MSHNCFYICFLLLLCNCAQSQKPVDTSEIININGIKQYIHVKGKTDASPLILILHGGPGGSLMQKTDKIFGRLQNHFLVVQWDQRETGETAKLSKTKEPLTLDMFYKDTHDLIDSLLRQYQKPKLYLVGYSWGSGMGFQIAAEYPQLLYAYIEVSPVIDCRRSDSISLALMKETMGSKANKELSEVKIPFENADQLYYHRKWLQKMEGQKFVNLSLKKSVVDNWAVTWFGVWTKSCAINRFQTLTAINCPVYFFAGGKDYNTNSTITREYYNVLSAPKKDFYFLENAGHALIETQYDWFQLTVIQKILPATE
jgi:pimeloyl-ACP methyl ester carboxylesterase